MLLLSMLLQCFNDVALNAVTMLQCYNVTMLQCWLLLLSMLDNGTNPFPGESTHIQGWATEWI